MNADSTSISSVGSVITPVLRQTFPVLIARWEFYYIGDVSGIWSTPETCGPVADIPVNNCKRQWY